MISAKKAIRKVAKEYGISVKAMKREMQAAINEAWQSCPDDGVSRARQAKVPCSGNIPTPEELIEYIGKRLEEHTDSF